MAEWKEKAASPVNLLHFAFSVGNFLAPLSVAPFLSKTIHNNTLQGVSSFLTSRYHSLPWGNQQFLDSLSEDHFLNNEGFPFLYNSSITDKTKIYIPFAFHGSVGICGGFLFIGYYLVGWRYQSTRRPNENTASTTDGTPSGSRRWGCFRILMAVGIYLAYIGIIIRSMSLNNFIFYVAVMGSLKLTKPRAAMLNTANNGSFVFGRFLGTIITRLIRVHILVFGCVSAVLAFTILLTLFAFNREWILWSLVCVISVFSGPCYPTLMAWADRYTVMDGIMVAIVDVGIASGAAFTLYVGAHIIHHNGPIYAFVLSGAGVTFLLAIMIILQIICYRRGHRFTSEDSTVYSTVNEGQINDDTEPLVR